MLLRNILLLLFLLLTTINITIGQLTDNNKKNTNDAGFINIFSYGIDLPGGEMYNNYSFNFRFGISPTYYFFNSNISLGISADYIFGNKVKNISYSNLLTSDGEIINTSLLLSSLETTERGLIFGLIFSKILPFEKQNFRTGLRIDIGPYYMAHWIHFKDALGEIPQLEGEYKKGYDQLTGGPALKEFIGYQYLNQKKRISFIAGFEFYQAYTKNLRLYNFSTASETNKRNFDFLSGLKIGWILPLYKIKNPEEIYY